MSKMVKFTVDNKQLEAKEGTNLLQAARDGGFDIPSLCYHPRLSPSGACRLCIVKINGGATPVPACTKEVSEGLSVIAFDNELEEHRRKLLDLFLADHDCNCLNCNSAGECELQDLGYRYRLIGLDGRRFKRTYKEAGAKYARFPFLGFRRKKKSPAQMGQKEAIYTGVAADCIRCSACIEACPMDLYPVLIMEAEQQEDQALLDKLHAENCINCELCSYVCPSEIRLVKYVKQAEELEETFKIQRKEGA